MVHAYLMYGFPTQTDQETIDSLEVVRQLFEAGVLQSGFWHRFAMTAHSPVGLQPEEFNVDIVDSSVGTFANNDLEHRDPSGGNHELFSAGLRKSLYNYMHGVGYELELGTWFDETVPETTVDPDLIQSHLEAPRVREPKSNSQIVWIGGPVEFRDGDNEPTLIKVYGKQEETEIPVEYKQGAWIAGYLNALVRQEERTTYSEMAQSYQAQGFEDFTLFWFGDMMEQLKELGLLIM